MVKKDFEGQMKGKKLKLQKGAKCKFQQNIT